MVLMRPPGLIPINVIKTDFSKIILKSYQTEKWREYNEHLDSLHQCKARPVDLQIGIDYEVKGGSQSYYCSFRLI